MASGEHKTPITDMEISVRGIALLKRHGFETVEAVAAQWPDGIAALPGMTARVRKEIGEVLAWVTAHRPMWSVREGSPDDHDGRLIAACLGVTIKTLGECEPYDRQRRVRLARNAAAALIEMADRADDPTRKTECASDAR